MASKMDLSSALKDKIEAQRQKRLTGRVEIDIDVLQMADGTTEVRIWMFLDPKRMRQMIMDKRIKVDAEINRDEVTKRPGNANSYGHSAENNTSLGQFAGHTNMSAENVIAYALEGNLLSLATTEFPFLITEGGHRTRWLERLEEARLSGNNRIALSILASTDPASRKRHVSEEFQTLNLEVAPARAGEVIRSIMPSDLRKACVDALEALFNEFFAKTDKKRGSWPALCNATINAVAEEDMSKLHLKSTLVKDTKAIDITQDKHDAVIVIVSKLRDLFRHLRESSRAAVPKSQELVDAEAAVNTLPAKHHQLVGAEAALAAASTREKSAAKEVVKREKNVYSEAKKVALKNAKDEVKRLTAEHKEEENRRSSIAKSVNGLRYELDVIGPILYGLITEGDDAIATIKAWMNRLLVSREAYDRGMRLVTESGTAARSYTEARYQQGWATIDIDE
jgi:hypothetical protein